MLNNKTVKAFAAMTDAEASKKFYRDILGFELLNEDGFGLEFQMNDTLLRVTFVPAEHAAPKPYTTLGWVVADIKNTVNELKAKGVVFEKFPFVDDEDGIWTAPGGTKVAWFKDPHGNVLSIDQPA